MLKANANNSQLLKKKIKPIAVLGAGAWGTALALVLARNQYPVYLWSPESLRMQEIQATRINSPYFPDLLLPDLISLSANLAEVLEECDDLLFAVPSQAVPEVLQKIQFCPHQHKRIVLASKGLYHGQLLDEIVHSIFPDLSVGVLSGPSFASEVAKNLPTAVVIASHDPVLATEWRKFLHQAHFRVYLSRDPKGVEIAGASKNVLAIASGICDGLCLGANARAALMTRGLAEITRLGMALGAQTDTFMGLAGVGDIVLTCSDDQSRNRRFGIALGKGFTLEQAFTRTAKVVEGSVAAFEIRRLARQHEVDMPIVEQICQVLDQEIDIKTAAQNLLAREPRAE